MTPPVHHRVGVPSLDRRTALKLLASGLSLSVAACAKPQEEIVPYVDMPERVVPGLPLRFATTLDLAGYGRGVIATSVEGRPIKIEGNPRHSASLGSTDAFAEASVLSLYDPDRSKAARHRDTIVTWEAATAPLHEQLERERTRQGAGLRLVTGRITSPTLTRQIVAFMKRFPEARWYRYEPISDDAVRAGATLAYGRALTPLPRLKDAAVVVALDADPLGPGPEQIRNARGFADARKLQGQSYLRLYAVEPHWTLTGINADHRLALLPQLARNVALEIAAELGGAVTRPPLSDAVAGFARAAAADLKAHVGRALIIVGPGQPAEVHALAHWINAQLHAPVDLIEPVDGATQSHADSLQSLADDLAAKRAQTLLILDANPAYDTPGELGLAQAIAKAPFAAHLGQYDDETGRACRWHLPLSHALESWSDLRATDGTASIVQPLIRPLYDTRTAHEFMALLDDPAGASSYTLVRQTWQGQATPDSFESWWRQALHDGVIAGSAATPAAMPAPKLTNIAPAQAPPGLSAAFVPDPSAWDGRFANNAWMQECPKPLTKEVWGNAILISPHDAASLGAKNGDVVEISVGTAACQGPVLIERGQAAGILTLSLGQGRRLAGAVGNGIGLDAYVVRPPQSPWLREGITVKRTGEHRQILTTQEHFRLDAEAEELLPMLSLAELAAGQRPPDLESEPKPTLLPPAVDDTYAWAMVIDSAACIGCNACVVACQAENNVPVVGPEQIAAGRDMHWLRIDAYRVGPAQQPGFQPVPCMHCEHAPCEPVCPVEASVHDGEGLNVQVYNRCIGTRFCQANCPYKVRRFNWFGYADGQEYADLGADIVKAANNPDVTVRARGVMEKCTYCVQRISRARRTAEKEDRSIRDGEVVTACQAACPTRAITFGDKRDAGSRVAALRKEPHHYALLGRLGTRPRTTYLARLRNLNPDLPEPAA
jgi:molybdopterin-containing oxidoreductase family iron-sulfur binding subunit